MGTSTDAIVCYGIELGDENEIPEWVWELAGVKDTRDDDDDDGSAVSALTEALNKSKLDLVEHCSNECPMYVLAAKKSVARAWRGSPVSLHLAKMEDETGAYRYLFQETLQRIGKSSQDKGTRPHWLICSMWS